MEENKDDKMIIYTYFVKLLRAALNGTVPDNPPENLDWKGLYRLADYNGVACTVYYGMMQLPKESRPESAVMSELKKAAQIVLGRGTMLDIEVGSIMSAMDEAGINYIPLKGWRMKDMYPRPDMRSMCDVDILVSEEDMVNIPDIMKECGFTLENHGVNHDSYHNSGTLSVEIHWLLFGDSSPYYSYFKDYYKRAVPCGEEGGRKCEMKFSDEEFFIHLITHMAKHFSGSGTGIRSVMDVYEYRLHFEDMLDWDYIDSELEGIGLKGFAHAAWELAYDMFAGETDDVLGRHRDMALHILSAGTYGNRKSRVETYMGGKYNNKAGYILHRVFPKLGHMKAAYPFLRKAPYLLPVFWCIRGVRSILYSRKEIKYEFGVVRDMDDSDMKRMKQIMKDSGLSD